MNVDASPAAATLLEIADGVFAWVQPDGTWWINNAGAIAATGDDGTHPGGTIIVDTCATYDRTRRFLDAVRSAIPAAPASAAPEGTDLSGSPAASVPDPEQMRQESRRVQLTRLHVGIALEGPACGPPRRGFRRGSHGMSR